MPINIERAKNVSIRLLEKDIKIYKEFIPTIRQMDDRSFENLFLCNMKYNYKIKSYQFKLLLSKYDNFKEILYQWYENANTYEYLEEL